MDGWISGSMDRRVSGWMDGWVVGYQCIANLILYIYVVEGLDGCHSTVFTWAVYRQHSTAT